MLGDLPINEITTEHILSVLKPVWTKKLETARRLRARIKRVSPHLRACAVIER